MTIDSVQNWILLALLTVLSCMSTPARGQDGLVGLAGDAPPHLGDGWQTATPLAVGMDTSRLRELTQSIEAGEHGNIHAVLIERDGRLVYEAYFTGEDETWGEDLGTVTFGRASLHDLRSVSKSVVSSLVGIAIDRGELPPVETPLAELLPEYDHLLSGEKAEIRLWHVLSMSAGLRWDEWSLPYADPANDWQRLMEAADPVAFVLGRELVHEPGTTFTYNGGVTYLLAVILERATGEELEDYARDVLFEPLGIHDVVWRGKISGLPSADAGLRMRPRDLAKIGSVFLSGGRWNGKQVVPAAWPREVAVSRVEPGYVEPAPDFVEDVGYGYQWWVTRYQSGDQTLKVAMMLGNGQQRVMVIPELGVAVTVLAGLYDDAGPAAMWAPDRLLMDHIVPAVLEAEENDP
jgi:CubicO group peptidase (beta-lactamase class C family)